MKVTAGMMILIAGIIGVIFFGVMLIVTAKIFKNKKREMITILARSKRGEQPKQFCFMCRKCFEGFCKENGIEMPDLMYRKEINNGK